MQQPEEPKPLQRHPALQPLSRAHHNLLMGCLLMEKGLRQAVDIRRIDAYAHWFLAGTVLPHFTAEMAWMEQLNISGDPTWMHGLQQEQECFNRLVAEANAIAPSELITELRRHVRFQERSLFGHLQQHHPDALAHTTGLPDDAANCISGWSDAFWVTDAP